MTVRELIKILKTASPNDLVVMSSDPEGNSYDTLCSVETDYAYKDGEIGLRELTEEWQEAGRTEEDVLALINPSVSFALARRVWAEPKKGFYAFNRF